MRGHIRERGKNTWVIGLDLPRKADGKRNQGYRTIHGTKKEAQAALSQWLAEVNSGTYVEAQNSTVAEYLKQWLRDSASGRVAPKTLERYQEIVEKAVIPALGSLKLARLTGLHLQGFYRQCLESGRLDGSGGLSPTTVRHYHRLLHSAFAQAVRWKLLKHNPADDADPPRAATKEQHVANDDEMARLLVETRGTPFYEPVLLALATGLRRGELLGLRWADVDLEGGRIEVHQAVEQTKAGLRFKAPKTARSRRTVELPAVVVAALATLRVRQAEDLAALGKPPALLVFSWDGQTPWRPDYITTGFSRIKRRLGLRANFHGLRHTHATVLLREGVHLKVVADRLGHSSTRLTADTYSHVVPGLGREAADRTDTVLRTALDNGTQQRETSQGE